MKYLRKFETAADADLSVLPNVVLVNDTGKVLYNVIKGVFIQHIDGNVYTTDQWASGGFAAADANGVAVYDPAASFVVAKDIANSGNAVKWGASTLVDGIVTSSSITAATQDFDGIGNTAKIIEQLGATATGAAQTAAAYTFPDGTPGYLPSAGEAQILINNIDLVQTALALIEGQAFQSAEQYWVSTQYNQSTGWYAIFARKAFDYGMRYNSLKVRAFAPLSI